MPKALIHSGTALPYHKEKELVIAPFLLGYSAVAAARWNDIIVGLVVIVLAV